MVAVHTARKFTSLVPNCVYDGGDNDLTAWLKKHNVRIVRHRSFIREQLTELGRQKDNPHLAAGLAGAFARVELPDLVVKLGNPSRILYTDCDVFFTGEVVPELEASCCEYFAVAPETDKEDYVAMNTGVMLMNMERLRESLPDLRKYILANLYELEKESWDEAAYRWYYRDANGPLWDRLRPELNWKPYWGDNPQAKIIHFHGPKPFQQNHFDSHWPSLKYLTGGAFWPTVKKWEELLQEAKAS